MQGHEVQCERSAGFWFLSGHTRANSSGSSTSKTGPSVEVTTLGHPTGVTPGLVARIVPRKVRTGRVQGGVSLQMMCRDLDLNWVEKPHGPRIGSVMGGL